MLEKNDIINSRKWTILFCCLLFSTSFPPIYSFWDSYISPKWYATLIILALTMLTIFHNQKRIEKETLYACWNKASLYFIIWIIISTYFDYLIFQTEKDKIIQWPYDNPVGLSLTLCLSIVPAMKAMKGNIPKIILFAITMYVVFLTKSRTGLIVMTIYLVGAIISIKMRKTYIILVTLTFLSVVTGYVSTQKKTSSEGRYFIAKTTMGLIMEKPLVGHGPNGFEREYMDRQGRYFEAHPDSKYATFADEICHPLNEYLLAWTNYGIIGLSVIILLTVFPFISFLRMKKCEETVESMGIIVFCMFSYPLTYPITWIFLILLYSKLLCNPCNNYKHSIYVLCLIVFFLFRISFMALQDIGLIDSSNHLYNKTSELYRKGRFIEAYQYSQKCREYLSSYNLELLTGDICYRIKNYSEGIKHYKISNNMCPSRFAPLEGLLNIYNETGDTIMASQTALQIVHKNIKIENPDVFRIIRNAKNYLNYHRIENY